MRKLFLLGLSCALATSAAAQTEKGARYIGANVGDLGYTSRGEDKYFSAILFPSAGVFVAENFLLGTGLRLSYMRNHYENSSQKATNRQIDLGVSPFARYYVPGNGAHRFFGELQGIVIQSYSRQEGDNTYIDPFGQAYYEQNDSRQKSTYGGFAAAVGYNYFLTSNAALEVTANYTHYWYGSSGLDNNGSLGIRAGFAVFLPSKGTATPAN